MEESLTTNHYPGRDYVHRGVLPPDLHDIDWQSAPSPFKLYRECQKMSLDNQTPAQHAPGTRGSLSVEQIGQLLQGTYGLTRERRMRISEVRRLNGGFAPAHMFSMAVSYLRPVPSGGGLFPCELYLLIGPEQSPPAGIYHYDPLHHALDILRERDYSFALSACLAQPGERPSELALLLSCMFWKDAFKYGEFSYRLQSLDLGAVIGQYQLLIEHYGYKTKVNYRFLDLPVNRLLGLDTLYESVYAIITPDIHLKERSLTETSSALDLIERLPAPEGIPIELGRSLAQYSALEALHHASCLKTFEALETRSFVASSPPPTLTSQILSQAGPMLDLFQSLYSRRTTFGHFQSGKVSKHQFVSLLLASTHEYPDDLGDQSIGLQHILLYCVVNAIDGLSPGIYCYHPQWKTLDMLCRADMRPELQAALLGPSHNMWQANICFFPVGNYEQGFQVYGDRWYRIQNMQAGIVVQRLALGVTALGLGSHNILNYHLERANTLLQLPPNSSSLTQTLVAPIYQEGSTYEQTLFPA